MRDTRHVEQQPVVSGERHQRGIAFAPIGNVSEKPRVGFLVGVVYGEGGNHRARIGQRHAGAQTLSRRVHIHGGKAHRALHLRDQHERPVIRNAGVRPLPLQPVGGKPRQPQAQDSPFRGKLRHPHSTP